MQFTTTSFFLTLFFALVSMMSLVNAFPVGLGKRDVYVPPVLYPNSTTVWKVGEKYNVTWDNSNPPTEISNPIGSIQLRKGNETLPEVLASNFSIVSGLQEIEVPSVTPGNDYCIVLMGDSGNFSPLFTIES